MPRVEARQAGAGVEAADHLAREAKKRAKKDKERKKDCYKRKLADAQVSGGIARGYCTNNSTAWPPRPRRSS